LALLLFDIGANRGDATLQGLQKGYKIIALEPAPKIYKELVSNFIYTPNVILLKLAVSNTNNERVEFYEAQDDGLSTLNKEWLTSESMPYVGKPFRTVTANTITIDRLAELYGAPDLIKIDVEGAEWSVFKGMTKKYGTLAFEWTDVTIGEHCAQLDYLKSIGYTEVAPQFIINHLDEPTEWFSISGFHLDDWVISHKDAWEDGGWKEANLRPTADVGMCWVR
jgi:FkbM family methyltransferase